VFSVTSSERARRVMPALSRARILCKKLLIGDNCLPFAPTSDDSAAENADVCFWFSCSSGNSAVSADGSCCLELVAASFCAFVLRPRLFLVCDVGSFIIKNLSDYLLPEWSKRKEMLPGGGAFCIGMPASLINKNALCLNNFA
jgi:hypothetical protein